jgi:hypothetical protein
VQVRISANSSSAVLVDEAARARPINRWLLRTAANFGFFVMRADRFVSDGLDDPAANVSTQRSRFPFRLRGSSQAF